MYVILLTVVMQHQPNINVTLDYVTFTTEHNCEVHKRMKGYSNSRRLRYSCLRVE